MTIDDLTEELDLITERAASVFCENTQLRAEVKRLELALSRQERKLTRLQEQLERQQGDSKE